MISSEILEDLHATRVVEENRTIPLRIYYANVLAIALPALLRSAAAGNVTCKEACREIARLKKP
jgi:hypothetical protein